MTDEKPSLVDAWVKKHKPNYPIAILKDDKVEKALGVRFFPTAAVVDPTGVITYAGSAGNTSGPLKEALAETDKKPLFPSRLAETRKLLYEGKLDEAYRAAISANGMENHDEALAVWTRGFRALVEDQAKGIVDEALKADEEGLVYRAVELAGPIAAAKVAFPTTPAAKELIAKLEALPTYKDELKGGSAFQKALDAEAERDYVAAAKAYVKIYKKRSLTGTKIAAAAQARANELVETGMCGYKSTCSPCRENKRACDKHHKKVRL